MSVFRRVRLMAVAVVWFLSVAVAAGSDNFYMSGVLEGTGQDVLMIEYVAFEPKRKMVRKHVPVREGRFEFSAELKGACPATLWLKSVPAGKQVSFQVYFVPDEVLNLRGDLRAGARLYEMEVSGSAFYNDLAQVRAFVRPFEVELAQADSVYRAGVAAGGDGVGLLIGHQEKVREINGRYDPLREAYVMSHPESEAAYSLVRLDDGWGLAAVENFLPRVRNGRFARKMAQDVKVMQLMALQRVASKNKGVGMLAQGSDMPRFRLRTPEGGSFSSDSLPGKYAVIDFWGSWCVWCIRGIPNMKKYHERYADRLNIVSIACSDSENGWRGALKRYKMPWTQVISDNREVERAFNVKSFPTKVVVGPDGKVLRIFRGEGADFYDYLDELLGT